LYTPLHKMILMQLWKVFYWSTVINWLKIWKKMLKSKNVWNSYWIWSAIIKSINIFSQFKGMTLIKNYSISWNLLFLSTLRMSKVLIIIGENFKISLMKWMKKLLIHMISKLKNRSSHFKKIILKWIPRYKPKYIQIKKKDYRPKKMMTL